MPQTPPGKQGFTANLTDEAHSRLRGFVDEHGAGDMVVFFEALCLHLEDRPPRKWLLDTVVPHARRLKAERSSRKPRPKND